MGTMYLYVIWDKVAETAGFVFEQQNDGTAIRSVRKQTVDDPQDFDLYKIGSIDHRTMTVQNHEPVKINWRLVEKEV